MNPLRSRGSFNTLAGLGLLAAASGCAGRDAVEDPTWADVLPIVQGQCLNCHGSTAERDGGSFRFDFLSGVDSCGDLAKPLSPPPSFHAARRNILTVIKPPAQGGRPKMPPEPGRLLEDWQVKTIETFVNKLDALPAGQPATAALGPLPVDARSPRIEVGPFARLGSRLIVDYVAHDEDGDPVIGVLQAGDALSFPIAASGAGQAAFDVSHVTTGLQFSAQLCDGWGVKTRGAADGLPSTAN